MPELNAIAGESVVLLLHILLFQSFVTFVHLSEFSMMVAHHL